VTSTPEGSKPVDANGEAGVAGSTGDRPVARGGLGPSRTLPPLNRWWFRLCAAGLAVCIGSRVLHYAPVELPRPLDVLLSAILHYEIWGLLLVAFLLLPVAVALVLGVLVLLPLRPRWCLYSEEGRWGTRPWLHSLLWTLLLIYNVGLDADPAISLLCWTSLPGLFPALWAWYGGNPKWRGWMAGAALWAVFFGVWLVLAPTFVERIVLAIWAAFVVPLAALGNSRSWASDRVWLALSFSIVLHFLLSALPLDHPRHGGTQIGTKDYSYTFCEVPAANKLFVAVPCDAYRNGCQEGYVAEHDTRDLSKSVEHHFFSERFKGRLIHLLCLEDTVQVGMSRSHIDGSGERENVLEFRVEDPARFRESLYEASGGSRMAYDQRQNAIFYTSEWSSTIFRLDRSTGEVTDRVSDAIYGKARGPFGSHIVTNGSLHEGRNSIFFIQWLSGSKIFEVDRSTLELIREYDPHHGGSHGIVVDDELDRIWVTGIWGVDVLEVGTGKKLWGTRLGLGPRIPVLDRVHDIVYVPNTSGRLWALDRRSLEVLGSLLVGGGSRDPYVSRDGRRLFAGANRGYFYWDTEELAHRFRPGRSTAVERR
jgi:hypothetical protein